MQLEPVVPVGEPADVLGNRPAVVVEDDDQALGLHVDDVVESLVARSGGQRPVADNDDDVRVPPATLKRDRGPQSIGEPRPGVPRRQRVVRALGGLRESRKAARRPDRLELLAPAGDELVRVALVGGVPDQPIFGAVEDPVECERQLDDSKVGGEVTTGLGDGLDDQLATVLRELG